MSKIKITPEIVRNIYKRVIVGETQEDIAKRYKVSRAHISKIKLGMVDNPPTHARWSHIWQELKEKEIENNLKKVE